MLKCCGECKLTTSQLACVNDDQLFGTYECMQTHIKPYITEHKSVFMLCQVDLNYFYVALNACNYSPQPFDSFLCWSLLG